MYAATAAKHLSPHHWACVNFESNVHKLSPITRLCGRDPATVTIDGMEKLAVRLTCESWNPETGLMVMPWFTAFRHLLSCHDDFEMAFTGLRVVSEEQAAVAMELEPVYLRRSSARASGGAVGVVRTKRL